MSVSEEPTYNDIPQWLKDAIAKDRYIQPEPVQAPIAIGDIRWVTNSEGRKGLVLVHSTVQDTVTYYHTGSHETAIEPSYDWVSATYLSNDVDLAADNTAILEPDLTGMPYRLLATGLCGSVFPTQLSDRYGSIPADLADGLWKLALGDFSVFYQNPNLKRGMPLSGRQDWRWDEIANLLTEEWQPLSGDAMCAMLCDLDGDQHPEGCPCSKCVVN